MFVAQFKLDHLVEKNNECIVYRASHQQQKYMVIQVNRNPIVKIPQYFNHFQKELDFIFKRIPSPRIVPQDFPFTLPQQQFYDFEDIELPQIIEIHQTDNHYYFVITNCLQGIITNQQYDPVKVFQQIFNIFDLYFIPFQQKQISDRDFNINRLFWSQNQLSIIDFGFQLIQKPQRNIAWPIKLGSLLNVILKQEKIPNLRKIVNLLLQNKIKQWEQVKELFVINLNTIKPTLEFDSNSQYSHSNTKPLYSKTQSLSMEPDEIIITKLNQSFCKDTIEKRTYSPIVLQSRIIRKGTNELKQHFDRIKKSLSPGMSNRSPYKLIAIDSMCQDYQQSKSISRRSYTKQFNVTKPIEVPFEYKQSDYEDQQTKNYFPQQTNQEPLVSTFVMPVKNTIKLSEIDTIDRSKDTYIPTILEQSSKKKNTTRPQTALNFTKDADPIQQTPQMKTLLRKSTRDLYQPDIRQNPREQTLETIDKRSTEKEYIQKPGSRRNSLRISSARKQSNQSIENIELNQDGKEKPIEKLSFKTPKGIRKESQQNTQLPQIQQNQKTQINTSLYEKVIQNTQQIQQIENNEQQQQQQQFQKQPSSEETNFYTFNQQYQQKNTQSIQQSIQQQGQQQQQQQKQQQLLCQQQQQQEQQQNQQQKQVSQNQKQIIKQNSFSENKDNEQSGNNRKYTLPKDEQLDEPPTIFSKKGSLSPEKKIPSGNQSVRQQLSKQNSQEGKLIANSKQNGTQILKKIDDEDEKKKKLNIFDGIVEQFNVREIQVTITDEEELQQFKIYETQQKKQDIIGVMVGSSLKFFQATKNYWIIPLFICFKRMVNFRFLLEKSISDKVNLFNLDMKKVSMNKRIEVLHQKISQENLIVINELKSLFTHCEQISKKFEKKELAKIEKYLNMDIDQDIKDIYFIYLYSQILKTIQQKYPSDDQVKQKENLKLQASVMASLIISEIPYSNDLKIFDYFEYEEICKNNNQKEMQQYLKKMEEQIGELKKRLIQKGIKI